MIGGGIGFDYTAACFCFSNEDNAVYSTKNILVEWDGEMLKLHSITLKTKIAFVVGNIIFE